MKVGYGNPNMCNSAINDLCVGFMNHRSKLISNKLLQNRVILNSL